MNRPTRGKIEVRDGINGPDIYCANGGRHIAYCGPHHTPPSEYPPQCAREDRANADRLAACWNACAGINPEAVPDLLAALKAAAAYPVSGNWYEQASIAIAKAEGRA